MTVRAGTASMRVRTGSGPLETQRSHYLRKYCGLVEIFSKFRTQERDIRGGQVQRRALGGGEGASQQRRNSQEDQIMEQMCGCPSKNASK